jgi:hypothetical protein
VSPGVPTNVWGLVGSGRRSTVTHHGSEEREPLELEREIEPLAAETYALFVVQRPDAIAEIPAFS